MLPATFRYHRAANIAFLLLATFLIVFPKGGIKLAANLPVTHGYVLLALFGLLAGTKLLFRFTLPRKAALAYSLTLPFQLVVLCSAVFYGFTNTGIAAAVLMALIFMPFVFLVLFSHYIHLVDPALFRKTIVYALRLVAMYGIFLFFFRPYMGYFFEIPYLTVNIGDVGMLDSKMIQRTESVFKLISTYNNGNLYGIALLILFPLYTYLEKNRLFLLIVVLSLVLTISRTVWWGMLVAFVIILLIRGFSIRTLLAGAFFVAFTMVGIFQILELMQADLSFIFDTSLGGRAQDLEIFTNFDFLPQMPLGGIAEIVYAGVLYGYGLIGLLTYLCFAGSAIAVFWFLEPNKTLLQRYCMGGLVTYLLVSISDGGILFIPIMAFFFFISVVMLEGGHLDERNVVHGRSGNFN